MHHFHDTRGTAGVGSHPPFPSSRSVIRDLAGADKESAVQLLIHAFARDPFIVNMFNPSTARAADAKWAFMSALYDLTGLSGGAPRGVFQDGVLVGISLVQPPQKGALRPMLARCRVALRTLRLGWVMGLSRLRLVARYSAACRKAQPHQEIHYVMMVAVAPERQGAGVGRELLQDTCRSVEAHPVSKGVGLNTENPKNVAFYRKFGFREVGRIAFPGFVARCMHKERGNAWHPSLKEVG